MTQSRIEILVEEALRGGYLTPAMEAEVSKICDSTEELTVDEYMALDRLMGALLTGEVISIPRKQFINVMEELVLEVAVSLLAELNDTSISLNLSNVAAYALNRLPPLYATTQEGAQYQRERATKELYELIHSQVKEAITINKKFPTLPPDRVTLSKKERADMVTQISQLLHRYAPMIEG